MGVVALAGAWKLACIQDFSGFLLEYLLQALYAIAVDWVLDLPIPIVIGE